MDTAETVMSICTSCRDGRESAYRTRGGSRLAQRFGDKMGSQNDPRLQLRGVHCMSQCKRSCVVSLAAEGRFTYMFGELDPEDTTHINALIEMIPLFSLAREGFVERKDRPLPLRARIIGRLPPLNSESHLISELELLVK